MYGGAYWGKREETREQAAARVADFVTRIAPLSEHFGVWYAKGRSKAEALKHKLELSNPKVAAKKLTVQRNETDRKPIPEFGFSLWVWNGDSLTLSFDVGMYGGSVPNSVVLWGSAAASLGDDVWRAVLETLIAVFDPDTARVKTTPGAAKVDAMLESWLTYHRGQEIVEHPEWR